MNTGILAGAGDGSLRRRSKGKKPVKVLSEEEEARTRAEEEERKVKANVEILKRLGEEGEKERELREEVS